MNDLVPGFLVSQAQGDGAQIAIHSNGAELASIILTGDQLDKHIADLIPLAARNHAARAAAGDLRRDG